MVTTVYSFSTERQLTSVLWGMIRKGITGFIFTTTGVFGNDNDLVIEEGNLVFSLSSVKPVVNGRCLLVWKRVNGVLKIFRDKIASDGKMSK